MTEEYSPVPCIVCSRALETAEEKGLNTPFGATTFRSYGKYGSTETPKDSIALEINVCDPCLIGRGRSKSVLIRTIAEGNSDADTNLKLWDPETEL